MKDLIIRPTVKEDRKHLINWLKDKDTLRWYPMSSEKELEVSTSVWMNYIAKKSVITADYKGIPCGAALIYIQDVKKISHHSLFAMIVNKDYRGKGIGTNLLKEVILISKKFKLEILLLEVYEGNPAIRLYRRFGFKEFGVHKKFLKDENGNYFDKIMMQKYL